MAGSDPESRQKGCGFQYKLNAYVFIGHKPINLDLELMLYDYYVCNLWMVVIMRHVLMLNAAMLDVFM